MAGLQEILLAIAFVSFAGLLGGMALLYNKKFTARASHWLISFASGGLLGAVFFGIFPELSAESMLKPEILIYTLAGIITLYVLEKILIIHHHHEGKVQVKNAGYLVNIGDSLHNFIDGTIMAAAFVTDFQLGIATALAVFFHEIPQEIGDFSIMLHSGMRKKRIIAYNIMSAAFAILGGLVGFYFIGAFTHANAFLLAFAAGSFLYIAGTDLLPETHKDSSWRGSIAHTILLLFGIFLIYASELAFG